MEDSEVEVILSERAVALVLEHHVDSHSCLQNLANKFLKRFCRTKVSADLDEAIELGQRLISHNRDVAASCGQPGNLPCAQV
jgi:hypothetical protein